MQTRTIRKQVTFSKPFELAGFDSAQPSGTYTLSLEEEQLDSLLFVGWRLIGATLELTHGGTTEYVGIDMQDLQAALRHDTGQSAGLPTLPTSTIARRHRAQAMLPSRSSRS
jgi:hypothetical protein